MGHQVAERPILGRHYLSEAGQMHESGVQDDYHGIYNYHHDRKCNKNSQE